MTAPGRCYHTAAPASWTNGESDVSSTGEPFANHYSSLESLRRNIRNRAKRRGFIISLRLCNVVDCAVEGPYHVTLSGNGQSPAVVLSARQAYELLGTWPILPEHRETSRSEMMQQRARRRSERVLIDGRLVAIKAREHGTTTTYHYHGCKCQPCMDAHAAWKRKQKKRSVTSNRATRN